MLLKHVISRINLWHRVNTLIDELSSQIFIKDIIDARKVYKKRIIISICCILSSMMFIIFSNILENVLLLSSYIYILIFITSLSVFILSVGYLSFLILTKNSQ